MRALVRGESEYEVVLDWEFSREQLAVCCTCPYYDEHAICKHIWATILAADMTNLGPRGKGRLGILAMEPDDYDERRLWIDIDDEDDEAGYDPLPSPRGKAGARGVPGLRRVAENRPSPSGSSNSRGPRPMPSRTVRSGPSPLRRTKTREVWYVLDEQMSGDASKLVLFLLQRRPRPTASSAS